MSIPSSKLTRELVRTACLAPSVENTQPWAWRIVAADEVELAADRSRQLVTVDPLGREMVISCGAALDHFVVAAGSFGLTASVEEFPGEDTDHDLLARIRLTPGELSEEGVDRLAAVENRRTDRRGARDWPVPLDRVERLAQSATRGGARVVVLTDPWSAYRTEQLVEVARQTLLHDPVAMAEQDAWLDRSADDGIPGIVAEPSHDLESNRPPTRFNRNEPPPVHSERPDVLAVVCTEHDDPRAWLWAGRCLSAFWLAATAGGLALTPSTQVVELPRTRTLLRHDVLGGLLQPQVLVRVGWPSTAAGRPTARRTPRRSLDDVLEA